MTHFDDPIRAIRWHFALTDCVRDTDLRVLLLHGTGGALQSWRDVTACLSSDAQTLAVDLPGHGATRVDTNRPQADIFEIGAMARALGALLQHVDFAPTVIVGHSAGAAVALKGALDGVLTPHTLVGVNAALVPPPPLSNLLGPIGRALLGTGVVADTAAFLARHTSMIDEMLDSTGSVVTSAQRAAYRALCGRSRHVSAAIAMMTHWDLPGLLAQARARPTDSAPLKVLAGARDRWIPEAELRRVVATIPNATCETLPGGHLLPEEMPRAVADRVLSYSARRDAST